MADEISTLALNVDLDCHPCYKQMKKALCKFPEIESHKFDEEQKKVIISGPFEPEKLIKKLCCKVGCKIIKGYVIILEQPKPVPPKPVDPEPQPKPDKTPSKPVPLVPGPVNIVIGPIGPVCFPSHCNGSRGNCQCGCGGRSSPPKSQDNCQCGCGGHSHPPASQGNCHCGCGGHCPSHGSQGTCQCGCGGQSGCRSHGSQGTCKCGCGGQSGCLVLIEEENGCSIM